MAKRTCSVENCGEPVKARAMCNKHYKRWRAENALPTPPTVEERFWPKVDTSGPHPPDPWVPLETNCWLWNAGTNGIGYGSFTDGSGTGHMVLAHRWLYEQQVGEIPADFTLDHLCRVTLCVRPDHMEPVTLRTNLLRGDSPPAHNARKTHCPQGHAYAGDNLYFDNGSRRCRKCRRQRDRERYWSDR